MYSSGIPGGLLAARVRTSRPLNPHHPFEMRTKKSPAEVHRGASAHDAMRQELAHDDIAGRAPQVPLGRIELASERLDPLGEFDLAPWGWCNPVVSQRRPR